MSDEEEACVALGTKSIGKEKSKRRRWMKEWYKKREEFSYENLKELRMCEPQDFRNFLRMDAQAFVVLLHKVTPLVQKQDTKLRKSISASQRLSITLRYLATGNSFEDLKFISAISPQSIGKIVVETCQALIQELKDNIKLPNDEEGSKVVAEGFKTQWNFPNCIGAVDGKHVAIKKPPQSGSYYFNYKKFCSIVLMAVVDSNYEFIMVDAGINGRISDGGKSMHDRTLNVPKPDVLPDSNKTLPYVFVGDDAFALADSFMKPYSQIGLTKEKRIFNYRLSRARRIVGNTFGILVSRFGVLQRTINVSPEKAQLIVLACCYLHNYLRRNLKKEYISRNSVDFEDIEASEVVNGTWRSKTDTISLAATYSRYSTSTAKEIRDLYCHYFNNEGKVSWQDQFM